MKKFAIRVEGAGLKLSDSHWDWLAEHGCEVQPDENGNWTGDRSNPLLIECIEAIRADSDMHISVAAELRKKAQDADKRIRAIYVEENNKLNAIVGMLALDSTDSVTCAEDALRDIWYPYFSEEQNNQSFNGFIDEWKDRFDGSVEDFEKLTKEFIQMKQKNAEIRNECWKAQDTWKEFAAAHCIRENGKALRFSDRIDFVEYDETKFTAQCCVRCEPDCGGYEYYHQEYMKLLPIIDTNALMEFGKNGDMEGLLKYLSERNTEGVMDIR